MTVTQVRAAVPSTVSEVSRPFSNLSQGHVPASGDALHGPFAAGLSVLLAKQAETIRSLDFYSVLS